MGELDIHAKSFLPFLSNNGYDIIVINTSHWSFPKKIEESQTPIYNLYKSSKIGLFFPHRLGWFGKAFFYGLTRNNKLINKVREIVKQNQVDILYSSWGSHNFPELSIVKKRCNALLKRTVYEFLTYPTRTYSPLVKIENYYSKDIINILGGRIHASERMLRYIRNVFHPHFGRDMVFLECFCKKYFYRERLSLLSEKDGQPHLIFIGSDPFDIHLQIREIIRRKIHMHICETSGFDGIGGADLNRFIHMFNRFNYDRLQDGTFATFMTQFDACLVTYAFQKASAFDRFYNSIPSRFSFALTAGIPITMPRGYLKGCEDILNENQIGFTYTDYDDLKNKLSNKELMNYYRRNAIVKSKKFNLEDNFEKIDKFLKQICNDSILF